MATYFRPTTLEDTLAAIAARPCVLIAGGTDHFPSRVVDIPDEDIVDISGLADLRRVEARANDWWLPCLTTWTDVIEASLPPAFDALKQAAHQVGGMQVQNAGTVAGNLCNASPAADGIPCLMALDAVVELASAGGSRRIPVVDFVLGPRRSARRPDEMVLGLSIPLISAPTASVFRKLGARKYLVISIAMVAAVAELSPDGRIARAQIAVGACSPRAERLPALEAALAGSWPDPALVSPEHLDVLSPIDDVRASAAYRRRAALELTRRAVAGLAQSPDTAA